MNEKIVIILLVAILILAAIFLAFYMYKLILIDAESRGIKRPRFWALLASSSQNGAGLPLYLFKRKGTLSYFSVEDKKKVLNIKKKIYALLILDLIIFVLAVIAL